MKIVLTVHQFLPEFSAGTEILTYETAKELKRRGHEVNVFTGFPASTPFTDEERFDNYVVEGIRVERFKHAFEPMGEQTNIQELEYNNKLFGTYFKEYLGREKPDVVHFFHLARLSGSAIEACRELNIPTVLAPTDFWFICPTAQLRLPDNRPCSGPDKYGVNCFRHIMDLNQTSGQHTQKWFLKFPNWLLAVYLILVKYGFKFGRFTRPWLQAFVRRADFLKQKMNRVDKVAIPTRIMEKLLVQNGLDERRTFQLPFGLNPSYLSAARTDFKNTLRLGYIGTLAEYKGIHVLLNAMKLLPDRPIELKIYGRLDDYPDYVALLKENSKDDSRIQFCGTFPNPQIGEVFSSLDALVVPSLWYENSPLVVYSAQGAKCPVIASNMAGISEVIEHGRNGILFEAGNPLKLAAEIDGLLENPEMLHQFSENARVPLTIQNYVGRLLEIYSELQHEAARHV